VVDGDHNDCKCDIGPRFKSPLGYIFLANLAYFHVSTILAISTYIRSNI